MEGRADTFRQLWFLEQPDPRKPHRKGPSKTVVLVRIRFSCYNKGPYMRVADRNLHLSPAHSGGRESKASRGAPGSSSPRCSVILGEYPRSQGLGCSCSLRAQALSSSAEGEAEGRAHFSLRGNPLEFVQIFSLPILEGESSHTPSLAPLGSFHAGPRRPGFCLMVRKLRCTGK